MLIDAEALDERSPLATEVCIVGSGPAGMAIAAELCRAGIRIVLLEQGGRAQLGGNASRWIIRTADGNRNSVRLTPFHEEDFVPRSEICDAGWPVGPQELQPWYRRAKQLFGLPPCGFEAAAWEEPGARRLPLPEQRLVSNVFQFGDGRVFHKVLREEVAASPFATVLCNATACEIVTIPGGARARGVRLVDRAGRSIEVGAEHVVLAAGGAASAHLLLLSDTGRRAAIGNGHGLVGRYLMDHPLLDGGDFVPDSRRLIDAMALYDLRHLHGQSIMGHLRIAPEALLGERLPQLSALFFPRPADHRERLVLQPRQERARRAVLEMISRRPRDAARDLRCVAAMVWGADALIDMAWRDVRGRYPRLSRGGWSGLDRAAEAFGAFQVVHQAEQPPRWDNRYQLASEVDAQGRRKLEKHWVWHAEDVARTMRSQDLYAAEIAASGLGRYAVLREQGRPSILASSTLHIMGTTRMHDDPKKGVVDARCRVHEVSNIFVAGSSTFVTGSFANPTLTIVALALRVAEDLKDTLRRVVHVRPDAAPAPPAARLAAASAASMHAAGLPSV
ncbi:MAG: GMC family oxidoreductase [Geminicoccaceae bacterium]|nr:GMC family oxidoreductase [Geminicoccaceae bacterium]